MAPRPCPMPRAPGSGAISPPRPVSRPPAFRPRPWEPAPAPLSFHSRSPLHVWRLGVERQTPPLPPPARPARPLRHGHRPRLRPMCLLPSERSRPRSRTPLSLSRVKPRASPRPGPPCLASKSTALLRSQFRRSRGQRRPPPRPRSEARAPSVLLPAPTRSPARRTPPATRSRSPRPPTPAPARAPVLCRPEAPPPGPASPSSQLLKCLRPPSPCTHPPPVRASSNSSRAPPPPWSGPRLPGTTRPTATSPRRLPRPRRSWTGAR